MNSTQKFYGLSFNRLLDSKRVNSYLYFKSIDNIKNRKTQYPSIDKFVMKKTIELPYKNYFIMESNKKYKNKIIEMREQPVSPKMNFLFLELEERIKSNRERIKEVNTRALSIENKKYTDRIKEQKPKVLKANYLSKLFLHNHNKYFELLLRNSKFRKKEKQNKCEKQKIELPKISDYKNHLFAKYHSKTECNFDFEHDQSKDNSIEQKDHKHNEISHQRQGHIIKDNN